MAKTLLAKIAAEHYDTLAESGDVFDLDDVAAEILADPAIDSALDELRDAAVRGEVRKVDADRTRRPEQTTLFGDSDQVVALDDAKRRRKGSITLEQARSRLDVIEANRDAVVAAAARERHEFDLLEPFFAPLGSWDAAVSAYEAST